MCEPDELESSKKIINRYKNLVSKKIAIGNLLKYCIEYLTYINLFLVLGVDRMTERFELDLDT